MFYTISQLDPNLLSVTGVIATILAVIFAIGAYTNSRARKKHIQELEKVQREEHAMHFRPVKSHLPGRSSQPTRSASYSSPPVAQASAPKEAPVAKISTLPVKEEEKETPEKQVLFRKVRLNGTDQRIDSVREEDQELYVWE